MRAKNRRRKRTKAEIKLRQARNAAIAAINAVVDIAYGLAFEKFGPCPEGGYSDAQWNELADELEAEARTRD